MILALNLNEAMKGLVLGKEWGSRRMKAVRFSLIHIAGSVMERGGWLWIRPAKHSPLLAWLQEIRERIASPGPPAPA